MTRDLPQALFADYELLIPQDVFLETEVPN